jgi:uncharacterized protein (TIGR03435 family)
MFKTVPTKWLLARITDPARAIKFYRKPLLLTAASIALAAPILLAQINSASGTVSSPTPVTTATPTPAFDVATIKPHVGAMRMMGLQYLPDGVSGTVPLSMLMSNAYGLQTPNQVSGGPDWVKTELFDVQAKMGAADAAVMDKLSTDDKNAYRQRMLKTLLADRFKLSVHTGTKQVPVYELVVAKGNSKLIDSTTDPNPKLDRGEDGKPHMGIRWSKDTCLVEAFSMSAWAGFLSQPVSGVGRPVLDKTGLTSTYDFPLNWSVYSARPTTPSAGDPAALDDTTSIFGALKEVGLQLHPATGPIDTVVIDHTEHPTEN